MKEIGLGCFCVICIYIALFALFGLVVAGIYYVLCLAFGWTFNWLVVFGISLVLLFVKAFFSKGSE